MRKPLPYNHPIPAAALEAFTHPSRRGFQEVFRHGEPAELFAANGHMAVRATFVCDKFDDEFPKAPADFHHRVMSLPWRGHQTDPQKHSALVAPAEWHPMEDVRPLLFRHGPRRLWLAGILATDTPVRVCGRITLPLAILQTISLLPRAEVAAPEFSPLLYFRFRTGEGLCFPRWKTPHETPPPAFSIFRPK